MKRDSSPPEAMRVSGPNGAPGLVETSNSTRSVPDGPGSAGAMRCGSGRNRASAGAAPRRRPASSRAAALVASGAERLRPRRHRFARPSTSRASSSAIRSPPASIAASLRAHLLAERRERVRLDPMLARQRRGCRTAAPRPARAAPGSKASASAARAIRSSASLASITRAVERRQRLGQQGCSAAPRSIRRAACAQLRQRALRPAEHLVEAGQRFPGLDRRLHRRPLLGQAASPRLPRARARRSPARMLQPFAVALGRRGLARASASSASTPVDLAPGFARPRQFEPAERVEQRAMAPRIEQAAIVMLAVDFDQPARRGRAAAPPGRRRPRRRRGCRRRPSASAGRSAARPARPRCPVRRAARRRDGRREARTRRRPRPGLRPRAPGRCRRDAERQAERVEQDRLAGAGLAGEHAKARLELELEPVDQHHVADRRAASACAGPPWLAASGQLPPGARAAGSAHSCACTTCCPGSLPEHRGGLFASAGMPRCR